MASDATPLHPLALVPVVITGTSITLWTQVLGGLGASRKSSMLILWLRYFAQFLMWLVPTICGRSSSSDNTTAAAAAAAAVKKKDDDATATPVVVSTANDKRRIHMFLTAISVCDILGSAMSILGGLMLGSGLYQICYSSVLVSSALMSRIILGRKLTWTQWIGILVITAGLVASGLGLNLKLDGDSTTIVLGLICTLAYALINSTQSVVCALMMDYGRDHHVPVGAIEITKSNGLVGFAMASIYFFGYTVPRWEELIEVPMRLNHVSWRTHGAAQAVMCVGILFHTIAHWSTSAKYGPVAVGLGNAIRTVVIFFGAAYFFCDIHAPSCLSTYKITSTAIVVLGVIMYVLGAATPAPSPKPKSPTAVAAAPAATTVPSTNGHSNGDDTSSNTVADDSEKKSTAAGATSPVSGSGTTKNRRRSQKSK